MGPQGSNQRTYHRVRLYTKFNYVVQCPIIPCRVLSCVKLRLHSEGLSLQRAIGNEQKSLRLSRPGGRPFFLSMVGGKPLFLSIRRKPFFPSIPGGKPGIVSLHSWLGVSRFAATTNPCMQPRAGERSHPFWGTDSSAEDLHTIAVRCGTLLHPDFYIQRVRATVLPSARSSGTSVRGLFS